MTFFMKVYTDIISAISKLSPCNQTFTFYQMIGTIYESVCEISAPAKAILSGEHAVVYGKDAIAVGIDLRCTAVVTGKVRDSNSSGLIIQTSMQEHQISIDGQTMNQLQERMRNSSALSYQQFEKEEGHNEAMKMSNFSISLHFKLALFLNQFQLSWQEWQKQHNFDYYIKVQSQIPVAKCLGSSAAFNTVLATALFIIFLPHHIDFNDLTMQAKEKINNLSLKFQAVEHGNPSGIDNYVSVNGGVILYNKNKQPKFKQLSIAAQNLKLMSLGVIDTGIEKNTKVAVGIVREKYNSDKAYRLKIQEIGNIAGQIVGLLEDKQCNRASIDQVMKLTSKNHQLLRDLGVSHPKIEQIVQKWQQLGWSAKITGSGMGGCVLLLSHKEAASTAELKLTPIDTVGLRVKFYQS